MVGLLWASRRTRGLPGWGGGVGLEEFEELWQAVSAVFFPCGGVFGEDLFAFGIQDDECGNAVLGGLAVFEVDHSVVAAIHVDGNDDVAGLEQGADGGVGLEDAMQFPAPGAPVGAEDEEDAFRGGVFFGGLKRGGDLLGAVRGGFLIGGGRGSGGDGGKGSLKEGEAEEDEEGAAVGVGGHGGKMEGSSFEDEDDFVITGGGIR